MWPRCLSVSPMTTKMLWKLNAVAQVILTAPQVRLVDSGEPIKKKFSLQRVSGAAVQNLVHSSAKGTHILLHFMIPLLG